MTEGRPRRACQETLSVTRADNCAAAGVSSKAGRGFAEGTYVSAIAKKDEDGEGAV